MDVTVTGGEGFSFVENYEFMDTTLTYSEVIDLINTQGTPGQVIDGNEEGEFLLGTEGDDFITGNGGNDYMDGGAGNDTYYFGSGDGIDEIDDFAGDADTLLFTDYTSTDAVVSQFDTELVFNFANGDAVVLYFGVGGLFLPFEPDGGPPQLEFIEPIIESFQFTDVTLTYNEVLDLIADDVGITADGMPGDDIGDFALVGTDGDDALRGNGGDDVLIGGIGSDTYYFAAGDGTDFIAESGTLMNKDVVVTEGYSLDQMEATYDSDTELVTSNFIDSNDSISFVGNFNSNSIEEVVFINDPLDETDNETLTIWDLLQMTDQFGDIFIVDGPFLGGEDGPGGEFPDDGGLILV